MKKQNEALSAIASSSLDKSVLMARYISINAFSGVIDDTRVKYRFTTGETEFVDAEDLLLIKYGSTSQELFDALVKSGVDFSVYNGQDNVGSIVPYSIRISEGKVGGYGILEHKFGAKVTTFTTVTGEKEFTDPGVVYIIDHINNVIVSMNSPDDYEGELSEMVEMATSLKMLNDLLNGRAYRKVL